MLNRTAIEVSHPSIGTVKYVFPTKDVYRAISLAQAMAEAEYGIHRSLWVQGFDRRV